MKKHTNETYLAIQNETYGQNTCLFETLKWIVQQCNINDVNNSWLMKIKYRREKWRLFADKIIESVDGWSKSNLLACFGHISLKVMIKVTRARFGH